MNNLPKKDPRPDFRITDSAIEIPSMLYFAVKLDGAQIPITSQQYLDNVFERGVPLKLQLGCELQHVKSKVNWIAIDELKRAPVRNVAPLN